MTMTLHVLKIAFETPSMEQILRSSVSPVFVELSQENAKQLVEHLTKRIEKDVPGTISFQLFARVEMA